MLKFPPLHSRSAYRFELRTGSSCDSTIRWSLSSGSHQSSQSASPTDDRQVSLSRNGVSVSRLVVVGVGGGDGRDGQGTDIRDFLILQCEPSAARKSKPKCGIIDRAGRFCGPPREQSHTYHNCARRWSPRGGELRRQLRSTAAVRPLSGLRPDTDRDGGVCSTARSDGKHVSVEWSSMYVCVCSS